MRFLPDLGNKLQISLCLCTQISSRPQESVWILTWSEIINSKPDYWWINYNMSSIAELLGQSLDGTGRARLLCNGKNQREGGEVEGKQDSEVDKSVTGYSNSAGSVRNCLRLVCAVRKHGIFRSTSTRKLSSAHVPPHFNRTLQVLVPSLHYHFCDCSSV
jgi:hypothetical protein